MSILTTSRTTALISALTLLCTFTAASFADAPQSKHPGETRTGSPTSQQSAAQWKKMLTPEQYRIMVEAGTEPPFANKYDHLSARGVYVSAADGRPLFSSAAKFDSGTGWPSFYEPITKDAIVTRTDHTGGQDRVEVLEAKTGLHLGHVFTDGPKPTGLRYCMNSAALKFIPAK